MITHLYDLAGNWIAFRTTFDGKYLFDTNGEWLGWFPWGDEDAVDRDGEYLGTVVENRLLRYREPHYRVNPGYPGAPIYPGHVGYPGSVGYFGSAFDYVDVPIENLVPA
ncbi:hypothetical protein OSC27_08680 [Microbacterium sp. STN6]|uniref:4-fold beta flower protein n=1 Tax=Microbacterium sp. STN6 TaxID=2995588 RepID=UPI002260A41C|nr:hypothetical protein [Microbacterium sp. STN6]MCX7522351.1 hypothetical protein [Microbacterium sp. STN6]